MTELIDIQNKENNVRKIIQNIDSGITKNGLFQEDNCFELTSDQESAIILILEWYKSKDQKPWKPYYVLSGAAGTGKSSLIQYIIKNLKVSETDTLCCAFTGKAALNLNRKGNISATLHSSIYNFVKKSKSGDLEFELKSHIPYKLIIVDEASMISKDLFDDILSFGIPTIFIGDHCQLPPIDSHFNIMLSPDFTLTKIMRQAKESPIIRASQLAIKGMPIPYCDFKGFKKIKKENLEDSDFLWADQIIVGTNSVRKAINSICREIRGIDSQVPLKGERMIVLKNNRKYGVFNGQIVYLESNPEFIRSNSTWSCEWADELEKTDSLAAITGRSKTFNFVLKDPVIGKSTNLDALRDRVYLDYGYAISCHKSQGSGWDKVLVFDEDFGRDEDTRRRWLYTAITRAKKEIMIVK